VSVYIYIHLSMFISIYNFICIYIHICTYLYIHMCIYIYTCTYVHIYTYIYTYTHTYYNNPTRVKMNVSCNKSKQNMSHTQMTDATHTNESYPTHKILTIWSKCRARWHQSRFKNSILFLTKSKKCQPTTSGLFKKCSRPVKMWMNSSMSLLGCIVSVCMCVCVCVRVCACVCVCVRVENIGLPTALRPICAYWNSFVVCVK